MTGAAREAPRQAGGCSAFWSSNATPAVAARLSRDDPEIAARVDSGELTINAAAVLAGIRPHRISVRLDKPDSIAQSLRRHLTPDQIARLIALLLPDGLDS